MSYFLDTNIIVYAFDPNEPTKQARARKLIAADAPWTISWQVVQEFVSVARHRFRVPLEIDYLESLVDLLLSPHSRISPSPALWRAALRIHHETQYRFYDSLIVAAAIESGVPTLYSEDLEYERRIGGLTILNPFV